MVLCIELTGEQHKYCDSFDYVNFEQSIPKDKKSFLTKLAEFVIKINILQVNKSLLWKRDGRAS